MLPVEALVQLYLSLRQVSQPLHLLPLNLVQLGSNPVAEELQLLGYCSITDFINLDLNEFFWETFSYSETHKTVEKEETIRQSYAYLLLL